MLKIRKLPQELQLIASHDLGEDTSTLEDIVRILREWIQQQPHLKARTDDQFLIAFLRGCKYSIEKAKFKIDRYYSLKTKYPDFYTIRNMRKEKILNLIKCG